MIYELINEERNSLDIKDILMNRKIERDMCAYYLNPDKQAINDYSSLGLNKLEECWKNIEDTINSNRKAVVIVDSDADGYCSAALMINYLYHYYPDWVKDKLVYYLHSDKQHGLEDCTEWILEQNPSLVIIPDAGSNDYDYHLELYKKGIKICILD